MKTLKVCLVSTILAATASTALAGGILTNTNQSIDFLRNPARDGAIGLDGVYSNPAGVAFMPDGLHLGFNWQYAHQTRTITSTNDLFINGAKNDSHATKTFEGVANAPFIPSLQAAWNTNKWSFQFNFSVPGGGGKCEFDNGIGSFETAVGAIANKLKSTSDMLNSMITPLGVSVPKVSGYDADAYMKGRQYYFGFQLGAARKLTEHLSVYAGVRVLYGSATYEARLNNIRVMDGDKGITLPEYIIGVTKGLSDAKSALTIRTQQAVAAHMATGMTQEQAMGQPDVQAILEQGQKLQGAADQVAASGEKLSPYANGMNLKSDQTGWGISPILGIDYKVGAFNFAAKYEFKTRMRMKNNSDLTDPVIDATKKFVNGTSVPEDSPALLTFGAQWSIVKNVRANLGYHHFFDTKAHWYEHSEKLLSGGTDEYLAGAEWDIIPRLTVSAGGQLTRYDLTDAYMNDMSFVVNSYSFGFGLNFRITNHVMVKAAYFQTNYTNYDMDTPKQEIKSMDIVIPAGHNSFTRTNRVFGLGCDIDI